MEDTFIILLPMTHFVTSICPLRGTVLFLKSAFGPEKEPLLLSGENQGS